MPDKICEYCGKSYTVPQWRVTKSRFCSNECKSAFKSGLVVIEGETLKRCAQCRVIKPLSEFLINIHAKSRRKSSCKACRKASLNEYYERNKEKRDAATRRWEANNPDKVRAQHKRTHQRVRQAVIDAYGARCVCCSETTPEFLAVDHIYNDGAEHRRKVGHSTKFYRWLRNNGFPKDRFQLLCHNCNIAKSFYGQCPHQAKQTGEPITQSVLARSAPSFPALTSV